VEADTHAYCAKCSGPILSTWKGWPNRNAVPLLPRIVDGTCESCAASRPLPNRQIHWFNYHSPSSTGLPDYWQLVVEDRGTGRWGLPYYADGKCQECGSRTVISEHRFPDGSREFAHNCPNCGVRKI